MIVMTSYTTSPDDDVTESSANESRVFVVHSNKGNEEKGVSRTKRKLLKAMKTDDVVCLFHLMRQKRHV